MAELGKAQKSVDLISNCTYVLLDLVLHALVYSTSCTFTVQEDVQVH